MQYPVLELKPGELEEARALEARFQGPSAPTFLERVYASKVIEVAGRRGQPIDTEVQAFTLGNQLAWVGLPVEIVVELGMAIKKASPFPNTIVVELANGSIINYVPNREAYSQEGYEVLNSRGAPGSGELLVDAAVRLLNELHQ